MAELTYKWAGDYLIPDLAIKENDKPIGKYGRMRLRYLKEHRKGLYSVMLLNGTLQDHLAEIDPAAHFFFCVLVLALMVPAAASKAQDPDTVVAYKTVIDAVTALGRR